MALFGGDNHRIAETQNLLVSRVISTQSRISGSISDRFAGNASGYYIRKLNYARTLLKITGNGLISQGITEQALTNETNYAISTMGSETRIRQIQDLDQSNRQLTLAAAVTQKIGQRRYFLLSFTYRLSQFGNESKGIDIRLGR